MLAQTRDLFTRNGFRLPRCTRQSQILLTDARRRRFDVLVVCLWIALGHTDVAKTAQARRPVSVHAVGRRRESNRMRGLDDAGLKLRALGCEVCGALRP